MRPLPKNSSGKIFYQVKAFSSRVSLFVNAIAAFLIFTGQNQRTSKLERTMKKTLLYAMAALYILAGINHFIFTKQYVSIMPAWLPWHRVLIYVSGFLESVYGILLIPLATRRLAALLIISLLIAIFPANIQMAVNYYKQNNPYLWLTIVRLPFQFVLIYWAYVYAEKEPDCRHSG